MRLLCRLGIHKWGKWSNEWYSSRTIFDYYETRKEYLVHRSLKCSDCDYHKHRCIETLTGIGSTLVGKFQPTWS